MNPNFFLVGAPKCGTTSMFHYLSLHPNVFAPAIKEPYFFCDDFERLRAGRTMDDYLKLFEDASDNHLAVGEGSVTYMYSKTAIRNVYDFDPAARLIVMVRNPCQLVCSLHSHLLYVLEEDEKDFAKAWELQDKRRQGLRIPKKCEEPFFLQYREVGMMAKYVDKIFEIFPREQVKIIFQDDLKNNVRSVYTEAIDFLGLPPFEPEEFPMLNTFRAQRNRFLGRLVNARQGFVAKLAVGAAKKIFGLEGVGIREKLREINVDRTSRPSALSSDMLKTLKSTFRDDVERLSIITQRDLAYWLS